jgi:drug/metabolite transporter (DMT)-like permease
MTVAFALLAAIGYGASDFLGGFGSRRSPGFSIAVAGQVMAALATCVAALLTGWGSDAPSLWWGVLAGIGSGVGIGFLYRGLAAGRMGVIAPVSAVGSALLPVLVGVLTGERPGPWVWLGVAVALPGVWLVASGTDEAEPSESPGRALLDGAIAGLGFGVFFVAIGQVPSGAGLTPLAVSQSVGLFTILGLAVMTRSAWLPRTRAASWGVAAGAIGAASSGSFMLASQSGLLTVAGVLSALYPAVTVILAVALLRERVHRLQALGLAMCVVSVALVATG